MADESPGPPAIDHGHRFPASLLDDIQVNPMRYNQQWHDMFGKQTSVSARAILGHLIEVFPIRSAVEFGCGHAHWLEEAVALGITDVVGVDGPWTNLDQLRIDRSAFQVVDLEKPVDLRRRFDLAICMEVAEHIDSAASRVCVDSICRHADVVLFGAAIPLQGGFRHVNEQWQSFWKSLFEQNGYRAFDIVRPLVWSRRDIHYFYRQNALVYVKETAHDLVRAAETALLEAARHPIVDMVHPEKYTEIASYEGVALNRLLPRLPGAVWKVLRRRVGL